MIGLLFLNVSSFIVINAYCCFDCVDIVVTFSDDWKYDKN